IPFGNFYDYSPNIYFQAGIFLEIFCFTLALSHRVYLIYKSREQEKEMSRQKAIAERDLAIAQVLASQTQSNPHFIFNSLNAIKYLIQSNQNKAAIKSLTTYSRFIRMILDVGPKQKITLKKELELVRYYLILESGRLEKSFSYSINKAPEVKAEYIHLPPMLLLPFLERVIWRELLV